MTITMLTYSFPQILSYSKKTMKELNLGRFAKFGGKKFRTLSSLIGFENAIRIKKLYQKF
jgi:hypothetical protein